MKRMHLSGATLLAGLWAATLTAQSTKVASVADHDIAMKTISLNARSVPTLLKENAIGDVKTRYVTLREVFEGVEKFWSTRNKDAVSLTANALAKVDVIIKAADAQDRPAIDAGIKELVAACAACHDKYREPDPATPNSFLIKKGTF